MIDLNRLEFNTAADFKSFDMERLLKKLATESFEALKTFDELDAIRLVVSERNDTEARYKAKKMELTNHLCRLMKYVLGCAMKCNINIENAFSEYTKEVEGDWVEQACQ